MFRSLGAGVTVLMSAALLCGCSPSTSHPSGGHATSNSSSPVQMPQSDSANNVLPAQPAYPTGSTRANPRGMPRGVAAVDRSDPQAVAIGFATAIWSQDARIDHSPWNAQRRGAELATPQYAATLEQPAVSAPGAAWNALSKAGGYTTAKVTVVPSDDPQPSTTTSQNFTVSVVVSTHGVKAVPRTLVMYLSIQRVGTVDPWAVSSSTISD